MITLDTTITMHMVERKLGDIICDATKQLEAGEHDLIDLVWDYGSRVSYGASHAIGLIRGIAIMMDRSPLAVIAQARMWKAHA